MSRLDKYFEIAKHKSTVKTEVMAGITTFLTMAYIVVVNPAILSASGMPKEDVFFATCVSSAIATLIMGLWAKFPFALAPGMGLNAFFAYTVCGMQKVPWPQALAVVLISGLLFLLLSLFGIRERILAAIPETLSRASAGGIGLFIAFIGLQHAGIVARDDVTMVTLGNLHDTSTLIATAGLLLTVVLVAAKIPGALLAGILVTAVAAMTAGQAPAPESLLAAPSLPSETLGAAVTALPEVLTASMAVTIFTFLFLDLFDTVGTLLALGTAVGAIKPDGRLPRADRAFTADAGGTIIGSLLGSSTVTSYIESASGVSSGGRTGLTAVVVAVLFLLALPLEPVASSIPQIATAPALIVVGAYMMAIAGKISWDDPVRAVPALATILIMPATYNISNGLGAGFILYVLANAAAGRLHKVNWLLCLVAALFVIFFILVP